jgi:hypothetical protein
VVAGLCLELLYLACQCVLALLQGLASASVLGKRHDALQIGLAEPVELRLQLLAPPPPLLAARLERLGLLGQPVPAVGALQGVMQGVMQALRMGQQIAEIAPDQLVELRGRDKASPTALLAAGLDGVCLATAAVRGVPRMAPAPDAPQLADPAADQRP